MGDGEVVSVEAVATTCSGRGDSASLLKTDRTPRVHFVPESRSVGCAWAFSLAAAGRVSHPGMSVYEAQ